MKYLFVGTRHNGADHLAAAFSAEVSYSITSIPNRFVVHVMSHPIRVVNLLLRDDCFRCRESQNDWEEAIYCKCNDLRSFTTQEERIWSYYLEWNKAIIGDYRHLLWRIEDDPKRLCGLLGVTSDSTPGYSLEGSMKDTTSISETKKKVMHFVREYNYHFGASYML